MGVRCWWWGKAEVKWLAAWSLANERSSRADLQSGQHRFVKVSHSAARAPKLRFLSSLADIPLKFNAERHIFYFLTQICLSLNLDPHLTIQRHDLNAGAKWPVVLESRSSLQVPNQEFHSLIQWSCEINARLVHLV